MSQACFAQMPDNDEALSDSAGERSCEDDNPVKYIGNLESLKFHRPLCPYALVMAKFRACRFHSRQAAVDAGMRPCRYCLPRVWKRVKAKLLPVQTNSSF